MYMWHFVLNYSRHVLRSLLYAVCCLLLKPAKYLLLPCFPAALSALSAVYSAACLPAACCLLLACMVPAVCLPAVWACSLLPACKLSAA
eukprot:m.180754 g.180754  ORF g.180754 m.180754 type:complete len:89 (+) comp9992_c0_seq19:1205-1471(+)